MAVQNVERDLKLQRSEREKQEEQAAMQRLYTPQPLPPNISEFKTYIWGKFTLRDVVFVFICEAIPIVLCLPLSVVIPQWICMVIGFCAGLPLSFLSLKHIFTGELPIEQRVKIALAERGASNMLVWDKTKFDDTYLNCSTQSFVPNIQFGLDNYVMLPGNKGGFAVVQVTVDDMARSGMVEMEGVVNSFSTMLNRLISSDECIPIQIMLKAEPKNLKEYINSAVANYHRINMEGKPLAAARAMDYAGTLETIDQEVEYYYTYYVVVTYREDAEDVGTKSMKSASNIRRELREKADPLSKKAARAREAEENLDIGEDRKKKIREQSLAAKFGEKITRQKLEKRCSIVVSALQSMSTSHSKIHPRLMNRHEISKLIYECYNNEDKNKVDLIIDQSLDQKLVMFSPQMYNDFPEIFSMHRAHHSSISGRANQE